MPCYEPPRPDAYDYQEMTSQRDRHIATIKEIEGLCQDVLKIEPEYRFRPTQAEKDKIIDQLGLAGRLVNGDPKRMAQAILDIIDSHWS